MATDHNFRIKNGLTVGAVEVIDSSGKLTATAFGTNADEKIEDVAAAMITGATHSNITVTYNDTNGTLAFSAAAQYGDSDVESYLDGGTSTPVFSTISSGAINATGDITITSTYPVIRFVDTDNNPDMTIVGGSGQIAFYDETNSGYVYQYISGQHNFNAKNLTNIGTISSGAITASNNIKVESGSNQVLLNTDGAVEITRSAGNPYIDFKNSTSDDYDQRLQINSGNFNFSAPLQVAGTTFIDTSLNLSNIGTISSGAITATTVNTGQGATEVHLMNQNIRTTDSPTFGGLTLNGGVQFNGYNINGVNQINGTGSTGWLDFNMDTDSVYPQSTTDNQTVLGSITHMNFVGDSNGNGTGGIFYWGYGVDNADSGTFTQTMALDRSGNLTLSGTVDGRDIATDGTKLDTIATNADVTPSWVPSSNPSYATQTYVGTQISNLVDSAPGSLDTLNELAAALGDDANFSTTVTNSIATKLPLAGGTLTGAISGTTATFFADGAAGTNALNILGLNNGSGTGITFSDNGTPAASASGQNGYMLYYHGDSASYGSGNAFVLSSSETTTTILADGKLMFKEGIYSKPSSGTGAGTRKDQNWDTAYGWGNHASAGYITSFDITTQTDAKYLRSDTTDVMAMSAGTNEMLKFQNNTSGGLIQLGFQQNDTDGLHHRFYIKTYKGSGTASGNVDLIVRGSGGSTTSDVLELHSGQRASWQGNDIFTDAYHPNADKWTTPRTLTLGGDLSGSVSFDGSANFTLTAAVANADTVDSLHASSFLRSDATDTATGALTFTGNINQTSGTFISNGDQVSNLTTAWQAAGTSKSRGLLPFRFQNGATGQPESGDNAHWGLNIYAHSGSSGNYPYGTQLSAGSTQNLWHRWWANGVAQSWRKIWDSVNDGANSGLDADLLDGQEGSYYLNYNNLTNKPTIPTNNNQLTNGAGYTTFTANQSLNTTNSPTFSQVSATSNTDATGYRLRTAAEVISGEGWCTGFYNYNVNDGALFLRRNSSGSALPHFHISGYNNPGYSGHTDGDGMVTLTRSTSAKAQGTAYAGRGLQNTSDWSRWVRNADRTIFEDGDDKWQFGVDGDNPQITLMYDDHASGVVWDTAIEIGRSNELSHGTGAPNSVAAGGYGMSVKANSDGAFFGIEQYSSGNYRPVIAWGDDVSDSPFNVRFNNVVKFSFGYNGDFTAVGNVTAYSDIKLKENIEVIDNAIEKVQKIRGVTFTRNDQKDTDKRHAGVIAQEVEKVLPEVVDYHAETDTKTVAYGSMVGLLIEAVKEQQEQIEELKSIINTLMESK